MATGPNSFLYRMPAGIPGSLNRIQSCHTEAQTLDNVSKFTEYGLCGKLGTQGRFVPLAAGDTAPLIYGLLVRPYPTSGGSPAGVGGTNDALGVSTPGFLGHCDALKRGYMHVKVRAGAAAKGGQVYVRVANPTANQPLGGIEAAADGANTVILPGTTYFMGPADANGNCEIAYNV